MRVLILGGTGSIGGAIVGALIKKNHTVSALSRSPETANKLRIAGAIPIVGDIRHPEQWIEYLGEVDAVIHAAATWSEDMDMVDNDLVHALLDGLKTPDASKSLVYTGGCWLYGNTGDVVATESTPHQPLYNFSMAANSVKAVLENAYVRGMVVHPAMVYERGGGVFQQMYDDIETLGYVRVFSALSVRWPLIHRSDLAQVYALMLQKGKAGDVYNASSLDGVAVGDIAQAISDSAGGLGRPVVCDIEQAKGEFGDWAEGYALDQQMSADKARGELGWLPENTDVFNDI